MRLRAGLLLAFVLLFFVLPSTTDVFADWLWFGEVGHRPVFLTSFWARTGIGAAVFVLAFLWFGAHLRHALRAATSAPASFTTREGFTIALPTRDQLRPLALSAAAIAALLLATYAASQWLTILSWWHQAPFDSSDPLLGRNA